MKRSFPEHWVETTLDNICTIETGKWNANHAASDGKYRFYTCASEYQSCHTNSFSGECIILPGNGANVGEVFYYFGEFDAYQRTYVLSNFKIHAKYSFYHLLLNWKKINQDKQYGSATNYIRIGNFKNYIIPLPPLNEQKRIAEKLDAILPKVKNARDRLEKIPAILKKFRQSVLAAACSGKLTEDWREEYAQHTGKELPEWEEKKIFELTEKVENLNVKNINLHDKFLYIDISSINNIKNTIETHKEYSYYEAPSRAKQIIKHGDVLFSNVRVYLKNIAIVDNPVYNDQICSTGFTVLRAQKNKLLNKYLFYSLIRDDFIKEVSELQVGSSYPAIKKDDLISRFIPLPPLEEQHEIVRRVEKLFALADSIEEKYKKAHERLEKLEQAILAKAFRGELVEPDPNDEPAEELLKRILEEKAKLERDQRGKNRKK